MPSAAEIAVQRRTRVLAAVGVASVSTLVAALAHGLAGGHWPPGLLLLLVLPVSVFISLPVVGTRVSSWRIATTVLVDQTVFHVLFSLFGHPGGAEVSGGAGAHAGHLGMGEPLVITAGERLATASTPLPEMVAGHLLAATVAFALLRGGWQLILRTLVRGASILFQRLRAAEQPVVAPSLPGIRPDAAAVALSSLVLRHVVSRRGPPRAALLG